MTKKQKEDRFVEKIAALLDKHLSTLSPEERKLRVKAANENLRMSLENSKRLEAKARKVIRTHK